MALISGNEKAWAAFVIGSIVQSLNIVVSYLPDTSPKTTLTIICAIVGTIGQGLGVYQIANTGYVKVEPAPITYPPNVVYPPRTSE